MKKELIFSIILMLLVILFLNGNGCEQNNQSNFCGNLSLNEITNIANQSTCIQNGTLNLTKELFCNNYTDTAWLGLDLLEPKPLCNPACVVNVITKEAEINWRCTGLLN
jgi:hypothetical protein